jgi:hypothetical protein
MARLTDITGVAERRVGTKVDEGDEGDPLHSAKTPSLRSP